jgi:molybdopterin-guanine dinucleotide biosynthesis protein B
VAVVKHTHHDITIDQPGKDSWRLAQAGSDAVIISAPNKLALIESNDIEPTLSEIVSLVADKVDIVLTEGYKHSNTAKIVVTGRDPHRDIGYNGEEMLAAVSPRWASTGEPQFDESEITMIIDLLCHEIDKTSVGCRDTSLINDFIAQVEIQ